MNNDIFQPEAETADPMKNSNYDGIQLPFKALFLSWRNGDPKLEELGENNVKYTGGWELNEKNFQSIENDVHALPLYFKPATMTGKSEKYNAYLTKSVDVVVIGMRERSIDAEGKPTKRFSKGSKSHIQVLGYMAERDDAGWYKPYAPVILSAKSNSSAHIKNAFTTFAACTEELRKTIKVPYYRFFIPIGTGKPVFETVGKGNNTHDITPCQLLKDNWTMDDLKSAYIGQELIQEIGRLQMAAAEWINDKQWIYGQQEQALPPMPDVPDFMRD